MSQTGQVSRKPCGFIINSGQGQIGRHPLPPWALLPTLTLLLICLSQCLTSFCPGDGEGKVKEDWWETWSPNRTLPAQQYDSLGPQPWETMTPSTISGLPFLLRTFFYLLLQSHDLNVYWPLIVHQASLKAHSGESSDQPKHSASVELTLQWGKRELVDGAYILVEQVHKCFKNY
jgi:hypothetical protein